MPEIIIPKTYAFAIEGQLYSTGNFDEIRADLGPEEYRKLVDDTIGQYAFMCASFDVSPIILSKKGLHPNIYKVAQIEDTDRQRLGHLKNTIEWLKENDSLGMAQYDLEKMRDQAFLKLMDEVMNMPEAWTEDGKLKAEFQEDYAKNRPNVTDISTL